MGRFARWMLNDWFTAHELDKLDERIEEREQRAEEELDEFADAVADLRADVQRLTLVSKALAELCIERGVLTREQLHDKMLALDVREGGRDGRQSS